jgi:hypothetical protein
MIRAIPTSVPREEKAIVRASMIRDTAAVSIGVTPATFAMGKS